MYASPQTPVKVYKYAFKLKADGKTADGIKHELIMQGLDDKSAEAVTENIERHYAEFKKKAGKSNMLYGAAFLLIGIAAIALCIYYPASNTVPYIIAFGAGLFGIIRFCRGIVQVT